MKVTIAIPTYNGQKFIGEAIESAVWQDFEDKEILIIDDASSDKTSDIIRLYKELYPNIRFIEKEKNCGLAKNLTSLMREARGKYIIYLCQDDAFTNRNVVSDMINMFDNDFLLGVIGRYYYQYINGHRGPVMTIRSNIYISSCQPSGIGFRKEAMRGEFSDKMFVEMPSMIKNVLSSYWKYDIIRYDTIKARLHPGVKGNAATAPSYFNSYKTQSQTLNWLMETGELFIYPMYLIQLKNRFPQMLKREILICMRLKPSCIFDIRFIFCAILAITIPSLILRHLSNFYRHRITRMFVREIKREECYA